MSNPIIKLFFYTTPKPNSNREWHLTSDLQIAKSKEDFRTATLDDLNDYGCVGKFITDYIVHVDEGFFEWNPVAITDGFGDTYGEYEYVNNIKDRVLDRMESLGMQDSLDYEEIISFSDWKIHSYLDLNDYSAMLG